MNKPICYLLTGAVGLIAYTQACLADGTYIVENQLDHNVTVEFNCNVFTCKHHTVPEHGEYIRHKNRIHHPFFTPGSAAGDNHSCVPIPDIDINNNESVILKTNHGTAAAYENGEKVCEF